MLFKNISAISQFFLDKIGFGIYTYLDNEVKDEGVFRVRKAHFVWRQRCPVIRRGILFHISVRRLGDIMEFEELREEYESQIKMLAYRLNSNLRCIGHEDLAQEALLCLWQQSESGKLEGKNHSYIMKGLYFHLKNYIRVMDDSRRLSYLEELKGGDGGEPQQLVDRHVHCDGDGKDLAYELFANTLTEREREVLALSFEGHTTREAGKKLDISHVRVVKILKRVRCKYHGQDDISDSAGADKPNGRRF